MSIYFNGYFNSLAPLSFLKNIPSSSTDTELVRQYQLNAEKAILGELYQRYMDLVYGVCLKYLKDPEDAKDAVINIFEELITKLRKHQVDNFRGWLYQLAKNHCLMKIRSTKHLKTVNVDVALMQSDENLHLNGAMEKEENLSHLEYCLGLLAPEQKQAIELFYLHNKCYHEIADSTGIEWNKVRSFIQNGRRNLKICMDKQTVQSAL